MPEETPGIVISLLRAELQRPGSRAGWIRVHMSEEAQSIVVAWAHALDLQTRRLGDGTLAIAIPDDIDDTLPRHRVVDPRER